jgi:hypothetical protein
MNIVYCVFSQDCKDFGELCNSCVFNGSLNKSKNNHYYTELV